MTGMQIQKNEMLQLKPRKYPLFQMKKKKTQMT